MIGLLSWLNGLDPSLGNCPAVYLLDRLESEAELRNHSNPVLNLNIHEPLAHMSGRGA